MSLRSVEEALTSLSYPHVAYRLEGGYSGYGWAFIGTAIAGVANSIAQWKMAEEGTKQAELGLKSTKYQAEAAKANANASVAIQSKILMGQQLAAQGLPIKIAGGLVAVVFAGALIKQLRR